MPDNEGSTRTLQACSDDFICTKDNVLWLLSHSQFFDSCTAFKNLQPSVIELIDYMREHGMTLDSPFKKGCKGCDVFKVFRAQRIILDAFAKIFIWLNDNDRMQELLKVREFASAAKRRRFRRIILAYAGKATKGRNRLVAVE